MKRGFLALASFGSLFTCTLKADESSDLLNEVRTGHRAAREAIRTFSASIKIETTHPVRTVFKEGRYWRSLDVVRVQEGREGVVTDDYLRKNDEIRRVARGWDNGRLVRHAAGRAAASDFFCTCDVWTQMRIEFLGPGMGPITYDQLLEVSTRPPQARRDTLDGRPCIRVSCSCVIKSGPENHVTLWHDIGYNYLVRRVEIAYEGLTNTGINTLTEFAEPSPGIVFPVRSEKQSFRDGELTQSSVITLQDVTINQPIRDSLLALPPIPSGTTLRDRVRGLTGPIDSSWNPIGPMKPLPKAVHVGPRPGTEPGNSAPSASEKVSSAWWIIAGSAGILIVALAIVVIRRQRSSTAT